MHSTILEGTIEEKRPPERPRNTFIGQIEKEVGLGRYRVRK